MKNRIFTAHLRRLFQSPSIYVSMVLIALLTQVTSFRVSMGHDGLSFLATTMTNSFGLSIVLLGLIPVFPYALSYADDRNTRMLYFWVLRGGTERYAVSYYVTTLLGAFFSVFGGLALFFVMIRARGFAIIADDIVPPTGTFQSYASLYNNGHEGLFFLAIFSELALGASAMAGIAAAAASIFKNKITIVAAPLMFWMPLMCVFPYDNMLYVNDLLMITWNAPDPLSNFLQKLLTVSIYWIACGLITVWNIRKKVRNA